jgi:hypothetical protein
MIAPVTPFSKRMRLHPKLPRVDQIPRSYALIIRDAIVTRIKTWAWFQPFYFTTNKALQIQPNHLPFCGVYFIEEIGTPDGDSNVGETRMKTIVRYGFSVIVQNNDANEGEYDLDTAYQAITRGLLADETLINWDGKHSQAKVQAFIRGSRTHQFGSVGADNEYPVAELRFDLSCDLGVVTYPPFIPDVFETMHVQARPSDADDNSQQVIVEYDLEQN